MPPELPQSARLAEQARRLAGAGRLEEAADMLSAAAAADPQRADLHNDLGTALALLGRLDEAIAAFERCLALDPSHRQALGNAATALERANRLDELDALLPIALAAHPDELVLLLAAGKRDARRGEPESARQRLSAVASSAEQRLAREAAFALGHLHDRGGRSEAADGWFERANVLWRATHPGAEREADAFAAELTELGRSLAGWRIGEPPAAGTNGPIFLLGFPRSGNTLLATMLESHGGFDVLDERPALDRMWSALGVALPELPRAVATAGEQTRRELREAYLQNAAGHSYGRRSVDKSPLGTIYAGLLPMIFADTRIVFLARHPYDVCLSCYMHDFPASIAAGSFAELDATARLYAAVLDIWNAYVAGGLDATLIRYEDVVCDPEPTLRRLLEQLGADWSERVLDFHVQGIRRAIRRSPNYADVSRPLYREARERWRRYATRIEPLRERLQPYVRALGYDD